METPVDISNVILETDRLILRPFRETDLKDFYAYASVPGVGEMAGWPPHESMETSRAILQHFVEGKRELAIVHKGHGKVIGSLGLHKSWANADARYQHQSILEIGYVLAKPYWGHGLMPEAVDAVLAYGFDTLGLDAFTCGHFEHNDRSRRVIEKAGFTLLVRDVYYAAQLQKSFDHRRYILTKEGYAARFHNT